MGHAVYTVEVARLDDRMRRENAEWARHGDAVLSYLGISSIEFLDVADDMVELLMMAE